MKGDGQVDLRDTGSREVAVGKLVTSGEKDVLYY